MNFEDFVEKYEPLCDENEDLKTFETYGEELDYIRSLSSDLVWTVTEGDSGNLYLCTGYHLVNRLFYLVCKVPHEFEDFVIEY
jgi:hypothetical protein